MRSVRCDACGTKALMAASKCPKCGHGFEVRDGFGDLLPLSHCATCDSYYPAKAGACRWCGTQPERAPVGPYVWKGLGVLTFVAMAWGAWMVHDDPPKDVAAARMKAMLKPDSAVRADSLTTTASAGALASAPQVIDSTPTSVTPPVVDTTTTPDTATTVVVAVNPAPPRRPAKTPPKVAAAKPSATTPAKSRARVVWVNTVARNWVAVRAGASRSSRVIASIGPNTRVQLGESKGGWRRIRAKGLAGWVEHRSFFAAAGAPRKVGRLATR